MGRSKLIKITANAVFAIIALDFLLCEFKYVIEFQPRDFSLKFIQTLVDYAVVMVELQRAIGFLQEFAILGKAIYVIPPVLVIDDCVGIEPLIDFLAPQPFLE